MLYKRNFDYINSAHYQDVKKSWENMAMPKPKECMISENIILGKDGIGHVLNGMPIKFGMYGIGGWASEKEDLEKWNDFKFNGKDFVLIGGIPGREYCIKYFVRAQ